MNALDLNLLKKDEPIYVIGHHNPDVDSMVSSVLLSNILNHFGIKAYYSVIEGESFPKQDIWIINDCTNYDPFIIEKSRIKDYKYILVDHNDISQSVGDVDLVIAAIDHHISTSQIDNLVVTDFCCVSLYLYDTYKYMYSFTDEEKKMIYMAYLCDTAFEKSERASEKDKDIVRSFGFKETAKEMFVKYFIPTDFSGGIEKALKLDGYRKYNFDGIEFESAYVLRLDKDGLEEYKGLIQNYDGNFLGVWNDNYNDEAIAYLKYMNYFKEFKYNCIPSRGSVIVKDVLEFIKEDL